jgi:hypothetical protein
MGAPSSFQHGGPNCRQIYEHVQGCPVCQHIFVGAGAVHPQHQFRVATAPAKRYHVMQQQYPPFVSDPNSGHQFMGASGDAIEISPTVAFLVVVLIVMLLVYMIRNMSRN